VQPNRLRNWLGVVIALLAVFCAFMVAAPPVAAQQDVAALEQQARTSFDEGRYASAVKVLQQIVAAQPNDRDANILLSFALARSGDAGAAIVQARRALELFPANVKVQLLLAGLLSRVDVSRDEALQRYQAVLQKDPDNMLARLGVAEIERAQGRVLDAIHDFSTLADRDPKDARYLVRLSQLYGLMGELDQARAYAERAYALAAMNVDAIRALAILGDVEDRPQNALRYYRELLALYPSDVSAQIAVRVSEEHLAAPAFPVSLDEMQRTPLERYMDGVPKNSAQLQYRREQVQATERRSATRFLPSFFVAPSGSTVYRDPKPALTDHVESLSFSFGWNIADLVADPYKINITGMKADFEAARASLMSDVSATYYQRLQNILEYRRLQRALALAPLDAQIRQNKQNLKYTILHLTERLKILTGMP
jgi:tetratricopeptide (TPR) repeat protein